MVDKSRRKFLARSFAIGCSAAASPLITPVTFAAAPWDNRLVVIILRGAMDGLDVVRPMGDSWLTQHRPSMKNDGVHDLNGFFAMTRNLGGLKPMWKSGELAFVHAVSTPYRDKRSHFDGQDMLEAGFNTEVSATQHSGWLNRMLSLVPGSRAETAFSVGQSDMIILEGDDQYSSWAPGSDLQLSTQARLLLEKIYEDAPLFNASADVAMDLTSANDMVMASGLGEDDDEDMATERKTRRERREALRVEALAKFAAERLNKDTRVASFSIGGWDTHKNQSRFIRKPLGELETALLTLKSELGDNWGKTAVLCMTEFGRTVRENGSNGSDHGTGGAMLMAGGAIRGGQIYGDWPGLAPADLYEDRDLMPTADVREYAAHVMGGLFGIGQSDLERTVFPGLDMVKRPNILL